MTIIKINNARFFSYHGVLDYEKKYGNIFEVDVEVKCDLSGLRNSDDLNNTVDYVSIYKLVGKIISENKFNLIESLNKHICREIIDKFILVKSVKVKIRKPNAPLGIIDAVEIVDKLKRE